MTECFGWRQLHLQLRREAAILVPSCTNEIPCTKFEPWKPPSNVGHAGKFTLYFTSAWRVDGWWGDDDGGVVAGFTFLALFRGFLLGFPVFGSFEWLTHISQIPVQLHISLENLHSLLLTLLWLWKFFVSILNEWEYAFKLFNYTSDRKKEEGTRIGGHHKGREFWKYWEGGYTTGIRKLWIQFTTNGNEGMYSCYNFLV